MALQVVAEYSTCASTMAWSQATPALYAGVLAGIVLATTLALCLIKPASRARKYLLQKWHQAMAWKVSPEAEDSVAEQQAG